MIRQRVNVPTSMIPRSPLLLLLGVTFALALGLGVLLGRMIARDRAAGVPAALGLRGHPPVEDAAGWVNGGPWTSDTLRAGVSALVYWSETDPASERALADAEAWRRAYGRYGVHVLGIHTPDFAFAADTAFAGRVARRLRLSYPIAVDPSYRLAIGVPGALGRPAFVIAGPNGIVFEGGAGDRDRADRALRRAIAAADPRAAMPVDPEPESIAAVPGAPSAAEERYVHLGTSRAERGPFAGGEPGRTQTYTAQFRFQEEGEPYVAYPVGRWTPQADGAIAARGGASTYVSIRSEGGEAWAVLAPPATGPARVWVLADGDWMPRDAAGADVRFESNGASYVEVDEPRLYHVARGARPVVLKLSPEQAGVAYYALVFEPRGAPAP
jgi:hypothetical protein